MAIGVFFFQIRIFADTVNTQQFRFVPSLTYEFIESSNLYDPYMGYLYPKLMAVNYSYVTNPFVVQQSETNEKLAAVLATVSSYQFAYQQQLTGIMDHRWSAAVVTSINQVKKTFDPNTLETVDQNSSAIGDIFIDLKYRFIESDYLILSMMGEFGLGTGSRDFYLSDGYSIGAMGIAEIMGKNFRVAGNLGLRYAGEAKVGNIDYRRLVKTGGGIFYNFSRDFGGTVEIKKDFGLSSVNGDSVSGPGEIHFGLQKKFWHEGWTMFGSLGTGALPVFSSSNGNGSDFRFSVGIKYTPSYETPSGVIVKSESLSLDPASEYQKKYAKKFTELKARQLLYEIHNKKKTKKVAKKLTPLQEKKDIARDIKEKIQKDKKDILLVFSNYVNLKKVFGEIQDQIAKMETPNNLQPRAVASVPPKPADVPKMSKEELDLCAFTAELKEKPPLVLKFSADQNEISDDDVSSLDVAGDFIKAHAAKLDQMRMVPSAAMAQTAESIKLFQERTDKIAGYIKFRSGLNSAQNVTFQAVQAGDQMLTSADEIRIEYQAKKIEKECPK